jgi:UDP-glucose 4-epimerase
MKVLITGSSGLVGSFVTQHLATLGHEIYTLDTSPTAFANFSHFQGDVSTLDLDEIFSQIRPDAVIHLAAQVSVTDSLLNPLHDARTNILGTIGLAQASKKFGVSRFLYANSGGAIYDSNFPPPYSEASSIKPISPYGISKMTAELYLNQFFTQSKILFVSLRLANVYGYSPYQSVLSDGIISRWLSASINGESLEIRNWKSKRDFVHATDVANAFEQSLNSTRSDAYNIGSGLPVSLEELFEIIESSSPKKLTVKQMPEIDGEILESYLTIEKAKKYLNWVPKFTLKDGILHTLEALIANKN